MNILRHVPESAPAAPPARPRPALLGTAALLLLAAVLVRVAPTPGPCPGRVAAPQAAPFESLLAAARRHPDDAAVLVTLGTRARQLGQARLAATAFGRAARLSPAGSPAGVTPAPLDVLLLDADALEHRGPGAAARAYDAILARHPGCAEAHEGLGLALAGEHRDREAFAQFRQALALAPVQPRSQYALGVFYQTAGLYSAALPHFGAAARAQPDSAVYWAALGRCSGTDIGFLGGQYPAYRQAVDALTEAVRLQPADVRSRLDLADMRAQTGALDAAEADYRAALALAPRDADACLRLCRFLLEWRVSPDARRESGTLLERAGAADPGNRYVLFYHGKLALADGDAAGAVGFLAAAVAHHPDADAWYLLSRAYRQSGRPALADDALSRAARLRADGDALHRLEARTRARPDDREAQLALARLNVRRGDEVRALNVYRACLALAPGDGTVRREADALAGRLRRTGQMPAADFFETLVDSVTPRGPAKDPTPGPLTPGAGIVAPKTANDLTNGKKSDIIK